MKFLREFTSCKTGENFTVEIEIDLEQVARAVAARAIHAKGQKSSAMNGDIKCRVTQRSPATPNTESRT